MSKGTLGKIDFYNVPYNLIMGCCSLLFEVCNFGLSAIPLQNVRKGQPKSGFTCVCCSTTPFQNKWFHS